MLLHYHLLTPMEIDGILKKAGLKNTRHRKAVIRHFLDNQGIMPISRITAAFANSAMATTTLWRILETFEKKKLIKKTVNDTHGSQYILFIEKEKPGQATTLVLFKCVRCGMTDHWCPMQATELNLPTGYRVECHQYLVKGTCQKCQA